MVPRGIFWLTWPERKICLSHQPSTGVDWHHAQAGFLQGMSPAALKQQSLKHFSQCSVMMMHGSLLFLQTFCRDDCCWAAPYVAFGQVAPFHLPVRDANKCRAKKISFLEQNTTTQKTRVKLITRWHLLPVALFLHQMFSATPVVASLWPPLLRCHLGNNNPYTYTAQKKEKKE